MASKRIEMTNAAPWDTTIELRCMPWISGSTAVFHPVMAAPTACEAATFEPLALLSIACMPDPWTLGQLDDECEPAFDLLCA